MNNIKKIPLLSNRLEIADDIVLVGHVNPDGDAIGSLSGMKSYLESIGKKVTAVVPNKYPQFLEFLDPEHKILLFSAEPEKVKEVIGKAQLIICMDFNSLGRIDALGDVIASAQCTKVLIDHHPGPDSIFNIVYWIIVTIFNC